MSRKLKKEEGKGKGKGKEVVGAVADGFTALLSLGKESSDGMPFLKGALGGMVWISDTCQQFKDNKDEWRDLASYIMGLHHGIDEATKDVTGDTLPGALQSDIAALQLPLQEIAKELVEMSKRPKYLKYLQTREDPKKIKGFQQKIDAATRQFTTIGLVGISRQMAGLATDMRQLHNAVVESRPQAETRASPPQLKGCPPPSQLFTGRKDILDHMHRYFSDNIGERHIYVLYGLGGSGKSQIAYKFVGDCQRKPERFSEIFFVDATTIDTLETDLQSIAAAQGLEKSESMALEWLSNRPTEWMLIFNNADDVAINLQQYFPVCSHGNILITTRNRELAIHAPRSNHRISEMSPDDATELLLKTAWIAEPSDIISSLASDMVKELGFLALAIIQAGAYMFSTDCGVASYLELYKKQCLKLLDEYDNDNQKIDGYQWTVRTTWAVSFERLSETAKTFLHICAFLHHEGIIEEIFENATVNFKYYINDMSTLDQESEAIKMAQSFLERFIGTDGSWDRQSFLKVVKEVRSYSLVELDPTNHAYSIHPLVHEWMRVTIPNPGEVCACTQYFLGFSIVWEFEVYHYTFRRSLLPHLDVALVDITIADLESVARLARVYYEGGRWEKAEKLQEMVMETRRRVLGEEHPDTLTSITHLTVTYRNQGRWREAEKLQEMVMETSKRVLGEEHPDTLTSIANLASTYWNQGRWGEAEKLDVMVMETRKRVSGEENPHTLISIANLAVTYWNQGRLEEAEKLQVMVTELRKQVSGEEHPETLMSICNLAATYWHQQRWGEAEKLLEKLLEIRKRVLGEDHPDTLNTMAWLGSTYWSQGRLEEAEVLQAKVVQASKRVIGEGHPDTLQNMLNLAVTYRNLRRSEEAVEVEEAVKRIRERVAF